MWLLLKRLPLFVPSWPVYFLLLNSCVLMKLGYGKGYSGVVVHKGSSPSFSPFR